MNIEDMFPKDNSPKRYHISMGEAQLDDVLEMVLSYLEASGETGDKEATYHDLRRIRDGKEPVHLVPEHYNQDPLRKEAWVLFGSRPVCVDVIGLSRNTSLSTRTATESKWLDVVVHGEQHTSYILSDEVFATPEEAQQWYDDRYGNKSV